MEATNSIVIKKELNGNILVTPEGTSYTLLTECYLSKRIDSVLIRGKDSRSSSYEFTVNAVEKIIRVDGSEVLINDIDTLFDELNNNVFTSVESPVKLNTSQFDTIIDEISLVNSLPYFVAVNEGLVEGVSPFSKFGRNSGIGSSSASEDIWNGGGDYTGFPEESETLEIFSSDNNDNATGSGARKVLISNLLDASYNEMPDITVELDGQNPVSLGAGVYHRCSRISVIAAGSSNENVGNITLRHTSTTSNVFAVMPQGFNQTQIFAYTVPAGKTLYIPNFTIKMSRTNGSPGSANVTVRTKLEGSNVWNAGRNVEITDSQNYEFRSSAYFVANEKTDVKGRVESVSDNNTTVTGEADGFLIVN